MKHEAICRIDCKPYCRWDSDLGSPCGAKVSNGKHPCVDIMEEVKSVLKKEEDYTGVECYGVDGKSVDVLATKGNPQEYKLYRRIAVIEDGNFAPVENPRNQS